LPILLCANHRSRGLGCNDPARCTQALRSGLIDASHARGLLDCTVDQQALNKIILRVAQGEAPAKA
jgi:hypothetical protein